MKLISTGPGMQIVMLPSGEQAFFYVQEPVACCTKHNLWYRVHKANSLVLEGHLENYLRAHENVLNWVSQHEMNEMVSKFGGNK